jgi:uroporphyrinogen decarboxylase
MDILKKAIHAAEGICEICWLGDDYASQEAMLFSPDLWRKYLKLFLKKQVAYIREHGMFVLFHSCGAVRPILQDLIDIGMNGLLVFQTTASGMDSGSISKDFGGKMVFYGGIDCQHLLTFGPPELVRAEVITNIQKFSVTGGYIVANTHHGIKEIRGENIVEMFRAVHGTGC